MKKMGQISKKPRFKYFEKLGLLAGFFIEVLATILNEDQVDYHLGHKMALKKKIREVFSITGKFSEVRDEWQKFYKIHFNWNLDFSQVIIPTMPTDGKWRLLFIPKGMTPNFAFSICEKLFKSWKCTENLNGAIIKNIRNTGSHYAVWVRDEIELDPEFLGKSTRQSDPAMLIGMTLLERIIFEIKYFTETGNHLDIEEVTLCSGSSVAGDNVPGAYLDCVGKFIVGWYSLDYSDSKCGIRSAISL